MVGLVVGFVEGMIDDAIEVGYSVLDVEITDIPP